MNYQYLPYPWDKNKIDHYLVRNNGLQDERFMSLLVPFIGGALLGGLFTYQYPRYPLYYTQSPMPMYQTYPFNPSLM